MALFNLNDPMVTIQEATLNLGVMIKFDSSWSS